MPVCACVRVGVHAWSTAVALNGKRGAQEEIQSRTSPGQRGQRNNSERHWISSRAAGGEPPPPNNFPLWRAHVSVGTICASLRPPFQLE